MFRTISALSLFTALAFTAMTFSATPQASAQSCWSDSSCGGKEQKKQKSCKSCLKSEAGKSWKKSDDTCIKKEKDC